MELEWVQNSATKWTLEQNFKAGLYSCLAVVRSTPVGWVVHRNTGRGGTQWQQGPLGTYETCEEAKAMAVILIRMEVANGTLHSR